MTNYIILIFYTKYIYTNADFNIASHSYYSFYYIITCSYIIFFIPYNTSSLLSPLVVTTIVDSIKSEITSFKFLLHYYCLLVPQHCSVLMFIRKISYIFLNVCEIRINFYIKIFTYTSKNEKPKVIYINIVYDRHKNLSFIT